MSKRRKKKSHDEHGVDESWLLPYSDLLTLLLALFIVLFASSSIDEAKFTQMTTVFNEIFDGGKGVMEQAAPTTVPVPKDSVDVNEENNSYLEDQRSLGEIQDRLDNYIAVHELENQFETKLTDEGLLVTIRDSILFSPGKADLKPEYRGLADDIAELLVFDRPRQIVITGHTDNLPMNNAEFSSNWELSVMRAVNFLKILMESDKIDPLLLSAKGYGEYHPIAPNDTAEGRSKNRRVEVLIQPLVLEDGSVAD
ncbi:flagellar motor protein motB [Bacillus sp. OxB-1]|uniref:flagellar motor protein MotB n=1 Tax=Bacillus sp. (strain OxB-1) TaxID=98228 RepID=UPI000581BC11|nr:flagellar motor protein MotB [Bacillus sp. OxB-1]BAQ08732.1 flagellar motor protein motB [Bacillus sp. OxB-1]